MVRPCKAVFDHMVSLLHKDKLLQYRNHFAEQVRGVGGVYAAYSCVVCVCKGMMCTA